MCHASNPFCAASTQALGVPVKWYEAGAAQYDFPVIAQVPILFLVLGFLETKR